MNEGADIAMRHFLVLAKQRGWTLMGALRNAEKIEWTLVQPVLCQVIRQKCVIGIKPLGTIAV
ncbi:hypothetical protein IV02_31345 [Pseudomonas syringae]|uniref:Uncharacterized protein n=1 Tax=Pseudomonas syringae TaxID=317 RepID=A0A085UL81_PSESX|nr:hypothetical protein IV02_31345 [Pseudomonas syringae]